MSGGSIAITIGSANDKNELRVFNRADASLVHSTVNFITYRIEKILVDDDGKDLPRSAIIEARKAMAGPSDIPPKSLFRVRLVRKDAALDIDGDLAAETTLEGAYQQILLFRDIMDLRKQKMERALFLIGIIAGAVNTIVTGLSPFIRTINAGDSTTGSDQTTAAHRDQGMLYGLALFNLLVTALIGIIKWLGTNESVMQQVKVEMEKIQGLLYDPFYVTIPPEDPSEKKATPSPEYRELQGRQIGLYKNPEAIPAQDPTFGYYVLHESPRNFWKTIQRALHLSAQRTSFSWVEHCLREQIIEDYLHGKEALAARISSKKAKKKLPSTGATAIDVQRYWSSYENVKEMRQILKEYIKSQVDGPEVRLSVHHILAYAYASDRHIIIVNGLGKTVGHFTGMGPPTYDNKSEWILWEGGAYHAIYWASGLSSQSALPRPTRAEQPPRKDLRSGMEAPPQMPDPSFPEVLKKQWNLDIQDVKRDESCQFRAVARQLKECAPQKYEKLGVETEEKAHQNLRTIAVKYMRAHPAAFSDFPKPRAPLDSLSSQGPGSEGPPEFERYLDWVADPRHYGDNCTLRALSDALSCTIIVLRPGIQEASRLPGEYIHRSERDSGAMIERPLILVHDGVNHYELAVGTPNKAFEEFAGLRNPPPSEAKLVDAASVAPRGKAPEVAPPPPSLAAPATPSGVAFTLSPQFAGGKQPPGPDQDGGYSEEKASTMG